MAPETERVHETWIHSDRRIPKGFVRPIMRFTQLEASSGSLLLIAAVVALVWANMAGHSYNEFWHTHLDMLIDLLNGREPQPFWKTHTAWEAEYDTRLLQS